MKRSFSGFLFVIVFLAAVFLALPSTASAHCDTLDGPVISAAKKALNTENVNFVLIWVKPENEDAIRKALKRAQNKRKRAKTKAEKDKADLEFFETLVKIHRDGEGAKYEGIKPAGSVEPEIALADKAVETGKINEVLNYIASDQNREIIRHLFHKLQAKSDYQTDNVAAGREFIETYVVFIHSVEKAIQGVILQMNEARHH